MSQAKRTSPTATKARKTTGTIRRTVAIEDLARKGDKDLSRKDPTTGTTYATRKKP